MTTITAKGGVLAADTMTHIGNQIEYGMTKIYRTEHFMFGIGGDSLIARPFFDWIKGLESEGILNPSQFYMHVDALRWDRDHSGGALLIDKQGTAWTGSYGLMVKSHREFEAIGSGDAVALGAMQVGASAVEAVQAASHHDIYTGGVVTSLTWDSPLTDFEQGLTPDSDTGISQYQVIG